MNALLIAPMASVHRRFNQANIQALKDLGYTIHLAANFNVGDGSEALNDKYAKQCAKNGITVHTISFGRAADIKNIMLISALKKLIQKYDFDIIHTHTETGGLLLRFALLGQKKTFKAIYTPHGMSFYAGSSLLSQIVYRPLEKWICSKMTSNLAMNEEEYAVLNRWNKKTSCFVHGIGLDTTKFDKAYNNILIRQKLQIPEDAFVVSAIGELNENKNHKVIIEALSQINAKNIYLLICGVGELYERLNLLIKQNALDGNVHLLGYRKDIPEILSASDAFVFPSFHEGLPVSVMEAMASGLPVICSRIRGNTDLIKDGEGGFLCSPTDVDGFKNAIEKLLADQSLREKMGAINKETVKKYDVSAVLEELKNIYSI